MTTTGKPQPGRRENYLFFVPSPEEREFIARLAQQEDRTISAVVRRIFRAGRPVYERQLATASTTSAEG